MGGSKEARRRAAARRECTTAATVVSLRCRHGAMPGVGMPEVVQGRKVVLREYCITVRWLHCLGQRHCLPVLCAALRGKFVERLLRGTHPNNNTHTHTRTHARTHARITPVHTHAHTHAYTHAHTRTSTDRQLRPRSHSAPFPLRADPTCRSWCASRRSASLRDAAISRASRRRFCTQGTQRTLE